MDSKTSAEPTIIYLKNPFLKCFGGIMEYVIKPYTIRGSHGYNDLW